jgi:ketosteroid isomerase-like protein
MQTDRDFSAMSVREGMHKAFLFYAADSGVLLRNNSFPIKSRKAIEEKFKGKSDSAFVLTWKPLYEKVSACSDLGYTYGVYSSTNNITGEIAKGTYVTIWQKQNDGNWKFILDTGNQGLSEKPE